MDYQLTEYRAKKLLEKQKLGKEESKTTLFNVLGRNKVDDKTNKSGSLTTGNERLLAEGQVNAEPLLDESNISPEIDRGISKTDKYLYRTSFILKCLLWSILQTIFIKLEFGAVFFVISGLYLIWTNLRSGPKKKGELSAYSVFNPNFETIEGTLTAEQFERELKFGAGSVK